MGIEPRFGSALFALAVVSSSYIFMVARAFSHIFFPARAL
jgi:hypothetical protein